MLIEDILRKIIREEIRSALGEMTPLQGESIVDFEERTSTVEGAIAQSLEAIAENENTKMFEEKLVESIKAEDLPEVFESISVNTNKELMSAIKDFCSAPGMAKRAKEVLLDQYPEIEKFSRVPDDKCQEVYELVVKELS